MAQLKLRHFLRLNLPFRTSDQPARTREARCRGHSIQLDVMIHQQQSEDASQVDD